MVDWCLCEFNCLTKLNSCCAVIRIFWLFLTCCDCSVVGVRITGSLLKSTKF